MNLKDGTRRLALLLGVAGAIFGGFVSYLQALDGAIFSDSKLSVTLATEAGIANRPWTVAESIVA